MALKEDILRTMELAGSTISIVRSSGNITEYCDKSLFKNVTNSFRLAHSNQILCQYNTVMEAGDFFTITGEDKKMLAIYLEEDVVEQQIISVNVICYKVNHTIVGSRKTKSGTTYNPTFSWTPFLTESPCVIDSTAYREYLIKTDSVVKGVQEDVIYMFVPYSYGIGKGDRLTVQNFPVGSASSGILNYEVVYVDYFTFDGISVLYIREDVRS